jgi:hypothetical protein
MHNAFYVRVVCRIDQSSVVLMADFNAIGAGFIQQYYGVFSTDRSQLAGVYRDTSLVTYGGAQLYGTDAIMTHFCETLTMRSAEYMPLECDYQPTAFGGVIAVINGEVKVDNEEHSLTYNDVFHLAVDDAGNYYVANQFSRILGGGSL